jgi:DNA-binding NarL/FixJ family response regulator
VLGIALYLASIPPLFKNAGIAAHLIISPKTVRNHVTNILNKLQVADRAQAIIRAREAGLG